MRLLRVAGTLSAIGIAMLLTACQRGPAHELKHSTYVMDARFSPDGAQIITGDLSGAAYVWDAATGRQIAELSGPNREVHTVMFSPNGSLAMTSGSAMPNGVGTLTQVWDTAKGQKLFQLTGSADDAYRSAISDDGRWLITFSRGDGYGLIWSLADLEAYQEPDRPPVSVVTTGRTDYGDSLVPPTWLFPKDREPAYEIRINAELVSGGICSYSSGQSFTQTSMAVDIQIIDLATSGTIASKSFEQGGYCLEVILPGQAGTVLVGETTSAQIRRWFGEVMGALGYKAPVVVNFAAVPTGIGYQHPYEVRLSPDGSQVIITATPPGDQWARIFDGNSGQYLRALKDEKGWIEHAVYSPDGRHILTTNSIGEAHLWEASTGEHLRTIQLLEPDSDSIQLNDQGLAWSSDNEIAAVAISPNGQFFATADAFKGNCDYKCLIHVWDIEAGTMLLELPGHNGKIESLDFSPDGHRLASAADDDMARIWDISSAEGVP